MNRFKSIGLLGLGLLLITSCRKDEVIEDVNSDATKYTLEVPAILATYLPSIEIPEDNPMTVEGVELGRQLFYDPILSGDGTQSCASCHVQTDGFTDVNQFSTGIDGVQGNRNAMPLFNLAYYNAFFWDGRAATIEEQAFEPVTNPIEMHNSWTSAVASLQSDSDYPSLFKAAFGTDEIDSVLVSKALAQFERTLLSGNAPFDKYLRGEATGLTEQEEYEMYQGFAIFMDEEKGDCFHCHGDQYNPLWTDNLFHNNGLDASPTDPGLYSVTGDASDYAKFKTPSLRNLAFTAPYMHDGRFATLDEVINHYSIGLQNSSTIDPLMKSVDDGGVQLTPEEKQLLKTFLLSLSDSTFISNPNFQAP